MAQQFIYFQKFGNQEALKMYSQCINYNDEKINNIIALLCIYFAFSLRCCYTFLPIFGYRTFLLSTLKLFFNIIFYSLENYFLLSVIFFYSSLNKKTTILHFFFCRQLFFHEQYIYVMQTVEVQFYFYVDIYRQRHQKCQLICKEKFSISYII